MDATGQQQDAPRKTMSPDKWKWTRTLSSARTTVVIPGHDVKQVQHGTGGGADVQIFRGHAPGA